MAEMFSNYKMSVSLCNRPGCSSSKLTLCLGLRSQTARRHQAHIVDCSGSDSGSSGPFMMTQIVTDQSRPVQSRASVPM